MTGPGLDRDGATLEDIREATGGMNGMFTTVPVNVYNQTFQYTWDTSPFMNFMQPGEYTIYVMDAPMGIDRLSRSGEPFASKTILFLKTDETLPPTAQSPLYPVAAIAALALTILGTIVMTGRRLF